MAIIIFNQIQICALYVYAVNAKWREIWKLGAFWNPNPPNKTIDVEFLNLRTYLTYRLFFSVYEGTTNTTLEELELIKKKYMLRMLWKIWSKWKRELKVRKLGVIIFVVNVQIWPLARWPVAPWSHMDIEWHEMTTTIIDSKQYDSLTLRVDCSSA